MPPSKRAAVYIGYNSFCGNLYKGSHEPIIDEVTYNKVRLILSARKSDVK